MKKTILFILCAVLCFYVAYYKMEQTKTNPYLTVAGPVKMADGIARQAVYFMDTLFDDVSMQYYSTRKRIDVTDVPERLLPLIQKKEKKIEGKVFVYQDALDSFPGPGVVVNRCLKHLHKKSSKIRIAYSMCESSRIPDHCVSFLNDYFDAIAVPDPFLVEVYQNSGITLPIFVLPLGLNLDPFLTQPIKKKANVPFCFVNTSSLISRKNHVGLIQAFHKAFGNDPNVRLHMNSRYSFGTAFSEATALMESFDSSNILLTNHVLSAQEYLDFLLQGDVFVTLSKGEGFSIQPREAMALGLPVIISDNTAHTTILRSNLAHGVRCPYVETSFNIILRCITGEEYAVDIDEAAQMLRYVYENYEQLLLDAEKRREWVRQYRYQNLRSLCLNLVQPKTLSLGDKNEITPDGLITSSQALYKKYKKILKK